MPSIIGGIGMKYKIIGGIIVGLLIIGLIMYIKIPHCSVIQSINASISVKEIPSRILLGMNTDKDSLKFGVVSPGTEVDRSINAQYARNAFVRVWPIGNIANWMIIEPSQFTLINKEIRQVMFTVNVPLDAMQGNYTGKVVFCFKDN